MQIIIVRCTIYWPRMTACQWMEQLHQYAFFQQMPIHTTAATFSEREKVRFFSRCRIRACSHGRASLPIGRVQGVGLATTGTFQQASAGAPR